jgi:hypothetical protein
MSANSSTAEGNSSRDAKVLATAAWRTFESVRKGKMHAPEADYFIGIVSKALQGVMPSHAPRSEPVAWRFKVPPRDYWSYREYVPAGLPSDAVVEELYASRGATLEKP